MIMDATTILLVEDEIIIAMLEKEQLESQGYNVIHTARGETAIEICRANAGSIDLILMDIDLGAGIDGAEAAERILAESDVPIVFLSSHTEPETVAKTERITSYGYVVKNSGITVLAASIKMALKLHNAHKKTAEQADITDRARMEAELNKTTTLLEQAFEQSPVPMVLVAMPGALIRIVNPASRKLLGITDEPSFIGTSLLDYVPSYRDFDVDGNPGLIRELPLARALRGEKTLNEEHRLVRKDGTTRWALVSGAPICGERGDILAGYLIMTDITGRKRAEEALRENEAHLRTLLDTIPDLVWLKDAEGVYLHCNRRFESFFGAKERDIVGKTDYDFVEKDLADFFRRHDNAAMAAGKPTINEERITFAEDGHAEILETIKTPIYRNDGRLIGVLGVGRDITGRKDADSRIQNLLEEKDLILKEVHHRIINNMNVIGSLLSVQADAMDDHDLKNVLLDAEGRVQSMMLLYDKLYRSEAVGEVSVRDYLATLVEEIVRIFPARTQVKIRTELDDITLGARTLSPLGIIINELVTNAMKYAFAGRGNGVILVKASRRNGRMVVTFEDDGIGIPDSVFPEGSPGFGLQLVGILVKQLNGTLVIERGEGTRFIIECPI
ncbi:MAG: response regulator [Spirochaetes bacterium]|nr:MAG: response regulator [Spirochaetota bacterium]